MYQQMMAMQQQMMALGAMVDASRGSTEVQDNLAQQFGIQNPALVMDTGAQIPKQTAPGNESSITSNARKRVADSTSPR